MQTLRPSRTLTPLSVSLSVALACIASLGCSSSGSSFDSGGGGSGSTNPAGNMAGTNGDPTNVTGGSTSNPTQVTGGSTQTNGGSGNTAGSGNPAGGTGDTGGTGTAGGAGNTAGTGTGGSTPVPTCPKGEGKCHEFIANDNGKNQVNYVNEFNPTKNWTTSVESSGVNSPRTIEIVDNSKAAGGKAVMVSVNTGYFEIDLSTGKKIIEVKVQGLTGGVTGACRLADGTTALGIDSKISIVNPSGVVSSSFNLPAGPNLRAINLDRTTGHYWLSKTETVYELNAQGQQVWSASMGAGTKGYAVWWRAGGGVYATTGEPATIVEIDANKQIVSTVGGRDNPAFDAYKLDFFSGFVRRPNGNYIVANWLGHLGGNAGKDTPMVIEFKPNGQSGEVLWTWGSVNAGQQTITNVYVFQ